MCHGEDYGYIESKRGILITCMPAHKKDTLGTFNGAYNAHHAFVLNNEFVPKSLTLVVTGVWIIVGGQLLVNGGSPPFLGLSTTSLDK